MESIPRARQEGLRHEALFYSGDTEFLEGTLEFIRDSLEQDEAILVVVAAEKIRALRGELRGEDLGRASFADMADVGRNPARIIPAWRDFVSAQGGADRPVRGIDEPIYPARSPAELVECQQHENLLNVAFTGGPPWWLVCPYDTTALDGNVIEEARRSHPVLWHGDDHSASDVVRGLDAMAAPTAAPLPAPPATACVVPFRSVHALRDIRRVVEDHACRAGLDSTQTAAVVLAADEIAANGLRHGGGVGVLRVWQDASALLCEVESAGWIDAPLAGRVRPSLFDGDGRGLWLANQLCDLVQVRSFGDRSVVRIHMRNPALVP
jgi:anti-sigma regulatory factor (Ser/Thr protein kinase)